VATLRLGMSGKRVVALQKIISADIGELVIDGDFGVKTEATVEEFQRFYALLVDGVAGPRTWDRLWEVSEKLGVANDAFGRVEIKRLRLAAASDPLVNARESLPTLRLSRPAAFSFAAIEAELTSMGGCMSTAGGLRGLSARVSANRSSFSRHYLGEAFDLGVPTGAGNPATDSFVITNDEEHPRFWRVFARVSSGSASLHVLDAQTTHQGVVRVEGQFVDFTELAKQHGFHPIPCRRSTWESILAGDKKISNPMGLEWWHFQRLEEAAGFESGQSTWGDALLRVWTFGQLRRSSPWKYRHATLGKDW